jgi:hypothetical protein
MRRNRPLFCLLPLNALPLITIESVLASARAHLAANDGETSAEWIEAVSALAERLFVGQLAPITRPTSATTILSLPCMQPSFI